MHYRFTMWKCFLKPKGLWFGSFMGKDLQEEHLEIWRRKCDRAAFRRGTKSVHEEVGPEKSNVLKPHKQFNSQVGKSNAF